MEKRKDEKNCIIAFGIILIIQIILIIHSKLGFCQFDESFYLSTAKRLYEGDRLILDEWHPAQFYVPIILPIYALYNFIVPSNEGVFIFFRVISNLFAGVVAIIWYIGNSNKKRFGMNLITAVLLILFSRANINGLSYYNLCTRFTVLAFILLKMSNRENMEYLKKCLLRFFCGGCISAAVLCQPFLVIPIFVVSIVALIQPKMRKCIISIYIGILFTASVYLILFFSADDMEGYINGLNYILSDPDHGTSAIIIMRRIIGGHIKNNSIIVLLGLCIMTIWAIYLCKKKQELPHSFHLFQYILCLASIIKPIICISVIPCYSVFGAITIATFPSMVYMILKKQWNDDVVLYCFGLAVAFSFGLGSNTWYDAMQSGYCISSMAALLCIYENTYKYLLKTEKIQKNKRIYSVTLHAFCTALLITVFVQRLLGFYFDAPLTKMTKRITDGPARGIYTTEENYRQYNNMLNVLKSEDIFQDKSAKIIHSYSNFPHQ